MLYSPTRENVFPFIEGEKVSYTYKDIARKANVSITTVSRVINKRDLHKVGKKSQEKVRAIIMFKF